MARFCDVGRVRAGARGRARARAARAKRGWRYLSLNDEVRGANEAQETPLPSLQRWKVRPARSPRKAATLERNPEKMLEGRRGEHLERANSGDGVVRNHHRSDSVGRKLDLDVSAYYRPVRANAREGKEQTRVNVRKRQREVEGGKPVSVSERKQLHKAALALLVAVGNVASSRP